MLKADVGVVDVAFTRKQDKTVQIQKLSAQNILNLRGSKDFSIGGGRSFEIDFDVFNVLNAATPTGANFQSGPSFGFVTGVIPARIARLGARLRF